MATATPCAARQALTSVRTVSDDDGAPAQRSAMRWANASVFFANVSCLLVALPLIVGLVVFVAVLLLIYL